MAQYVTRVGTERAVMDVFAYMADLRHFVDWDPGVRRVTQVEGEGGGTSAVFDVTLSGGRGTTLRYRTVEHTPPTSLVVRAENALLVSTDRISVVADGAGAIVTYDAELRLKGLMRIGSLGLSLVFRRIGDRAAAGLRRVLDGVAVSS